jgi:maltokinase
MHPKWLQLRLLLTTKNSSTRKNRKLRSDESRPPFAARGATSEDSDSTEHESQPAKPKGAPKLGHTWSERSQNSGSDRGTFGEQVSDRQDKTRDDAAARSEESSDKSRGDSKPAGGSVFDDLLGTERKRNRMKKRKKD